MSPPKIGRLFIGGEFICDRVLLFRVVHSKGGKENSNYKVIPLENIIMD